MYLQGGVPNAMAQLWQAVAQAFGMPISISFDDPLSEQSVKGDCLLVQHCSYPYVAQWQAHNMIQPFACLDYAIEGAENGTYRSAVVVRDDDTAKSLTHLRGRRLVMNDALSNSGMNLLRHAIAPLADSRPFFENVTISGSHVASMEAVATGYADVAAIDGVTWAYAKNENGALVEKLRVLTYTAPSPTLPLFVKSTTPQPVRDALLAAWHAVLEDPTQQEGLSYLKIRGFKPITDKELAVVKRYAEQARAQGYPQLI